MGARVSHRPTPWARADPATSSSANVVLTMERRITDETTRRGMRLRNGRGAARQPSPGAPPRLALVSPTRDMSHPLSLAEDLRISSGRFDNVVVPDGIHLPPPPPPPLATRAKDGVVRLTARSIRALYYRVNAPRGLRARTSGGSSQSPSATIPPAAIPFTIVSKRWPYSSVGA